MGAGECFASTEATGMESPAAEQGSTDMRILAVLGFVLLAIVGSCAVLLGYTSFKSGELEKTAVPYLRKVIPELTRWDMAAVKTYMAPEALKDMPDDKLAKLLVWESRLGHLQHMDEPRFTNLMSGANTTLGAYQLVTYVVPVRFDAGDGTITVRLLVKDGKFSVYLFHVDSMALIGGQGQDPVPMPAPAPDASKI